MASGRVKWFNSAKGFGFIEKLSGSGRSGIGGADLAATARDEVFVHYSSIQGEGYRALTEGQEVEFDEYESEKGRIARNVTLREL